MDIFLIFLLALIGVAALVGIILAVKILEFIHKNRESTIGDIEPRLKTLLMHLLDVYKRQTETFKLLRRLFRINT